jgi:hypothetical protein
MLIPGRPLDRAFGQKTCARGSTRQIRWASAGIGRRIFHHPDENQSSPKITRRFLRVRMMRMLTHRAVARVAIAARRPRAAALMILAACGRFTDARVAVSAQADGTEQHHSRSRYHSESAHGLLRVLFASLRSAAHGFLNAARRLVCSVRFAHLMADSLARSAYGFASVRSA